MVEIEELEKLLMSGKTIEEVLKIFGWREFEDIVSEIFKRNEFSVRKNFRFKTDKRYEIDVLAFKNDFIFCVDCKRWSAGRYKKSGIKKSAEINEKRVKALKDFLKKEYPHSKFFSVIVTLLEEDLVVEGKTFIVPIHKLNSFISEVETFQVLHEF